MLSMKSCLEENSLITIRIINIQGREVENLYNGYQAPGFYQLKWNASNYTSGMYFVDMLVHSGEQNIYRDICHFEWCLLNELRYQ